MTLIFVRILSMLLSKPTVGTESDLCGKRMEANNICKVDRNEHCFKVKERLLCGAEVIFSLLL